MIALPSARTMHIICRLHFLVPSRLVRVRISITTQVSEMPSSPGLRVVHECVRRLCASIATVFFALGFGLACVLLHEQHRRAAARHRFQHVDEAVIERQYDRFESAEVVVARGELLRRVLADFMTGKRNSDHMIKTRSVSTS